jgi:uncharacterized protein
VKVFLDTNVIASATATRGLCADVLRTVIEFHELVVSDHLIAELSRILKDKFGASSEMITDVVWLLQQDTISAQVTPIADLPLSDIADVAIVSSAINGVADILITGDKEILGLKHVGTMKILSPRQFWENERGQQVRA